MKSNALRPEVRVAVFAKAPVAGEVKTRLAPMLGANAAATLHARLVQHALAVALQAHAGPVELWCSPDTSHPFFLRCADELGVVLRAQQGADLGERMAQAFGAGGPLVLIGSDCPALAARDVTAAAAALRTHDAVFAPAEDGGYVLVGLARPLAEAFARIEWGTSSVMAATRERLRDAGATWLELPMLWDVDRPADYARLQREGLLLEALS